MTASWLCTAGLACVALGGILGLAGCRPATPTPAAVELPVAREVVFVVPHADDESLFAAELISHYRARGAKVRLIYGTNSGGGTLATALPEYAAARRLALAEFCARLPGVEVTIAPIPDGSALGVPSKARRLAAFLRRPGMVPREAAVFVIAGSGNSDHVDCREDVLSLMARRHRPVFLYWGYGRDPGTLDPAGSGVPVEFVPEPADRAFKRWAIGVYDRVVYRDSRFAPYRPRIMDHGGDDVVTMVRPRVPSSGLRGRRPRGNRSR